MGLLGTAAKVVAGTAIAKKALDAAYDKISNNEELSDSIKIIENKLKHTKCEKCGTYVNGSTKFCPNCGATIILDQNIDFGITQSDFFDANNESDVDYDAEVSLKYRLGKDEILLLRNDDVEIFGDCECSTGIVLLTNKQIVIEGAVGFFQKEPRIWSYKLVNLKELDGIPQVKQSKYEDEPVLELCFRNDNLLFCFDEVGNEQKQIQRIQKWIGTIIGAYSKKERDRKVCPNCGKEVPFEFTFCTECGFAIGTESITPVNQKPDTKDVQIENSMAEEQKRSIEQQIDLLQKLKVLVESGILSTEEFEQKKREILK